LAGNQTRFLQRLHVTVFSAMQCCVGIQSLRRARALTQQGRRLYPAHRSLPRAHVVAHLSLVERMAARLQSTSVKLVAGTITASVMDMWSSSIHQQHTALSFSF
jgi:hypothetical protein